MTTWNLVNSYTPSGGPVGASASPGVASAAGWVDESGNVWSIDSSNRIVPVAGTSTGSPWNTAVLRRASSETTVNGRFRFRTTLATTNTGLYPLLRITGAPGSTRNGYIVGLGSSTNVTFGKVINGSFSGITPTISQAFSFTAGDYVYDAMVEQTNGTTTTLTLNQYASDGTTLIGVATATDTTAALQNVAGSTGIFQFASGTFWGLTNLQVYTDQAVSSATSYTLSGPSSGAVGTASSVFTVASGGSLASAVTVTPSDGGAGGSFSPTTVTLSAGVGTSGTFTYTPASAGAKTISATNNGGLTNPASVTYTAVVLNTIAVNSAAFRFSPGNWKGDTGRGGSSYRKTWNIGAYFEVKWTAAASSPSATILIPSTSTGATISYLLNGVLTDNVAATGNVTLSGIAAGASNTLTVFLRTSPQTTRWNNALQTLQINGLQIDSGSSAGTAATVSGWDIIVGDSLTEGSGIEGGDTFMRCWAHLFGQAIRDLGRDYNVNACGFSGYLRPGDNTGDVPAYYSVSGGTYADASSRWNKIDSGVSLLDSAGKISAYGSTGTQPSNIWINLGTNEAVSGSSLSDTTASVTQCITALRGAAPSAKINVIVPFALYATAAVSSGPTYIAAIKAGFAAYQSANPTDTNVALIDFGSTFSAQLTSSLYGGAVVHGNSALQALEAARMIPKLGAAPAANNSPSSAPVAWFSRVTLGRR